MDFAFWNFGMEGSDKIEKRMLTCEELADYIGLSVQTIRNKLSQGKFPIPAKRIFSKLLWDRRDVDKYIDRLPKIDC